MEEQEEKERQREKVCIQKLQLCTSLRSTKRTYRDMLYNLHHT